MYAQPVQQNALVKSYETTHGPVELSPTVVRKYLVNGGGNVTDQEVSRFINMCYYQKLNPFLREAYLVKFGKQPATMITGKDAFTKRAQKNSNCTGWKAGVIVRAKDGSISERDGSAIMNGEKLEGGWAEVYRKDWQVPMKITVGIREYVRRKKDGTIMSNWLSMPGTMIRKVALVQALREAFPEDFQGLYSEEEMPVDQTLLNREPLKHAEGEVIDIQDPIVMASEEQLKTIGSLMKKLHWQKRDLTYNANRMFNKKTSQLSQNEAQQFINYLEQHVKSIKH